MLKVSLGHTSLTGPRPRNEDFCGAVTPEGVELDHKGLLAAVADGVGGHADGREAAEHTVRGLLADYYATPETWSVPQSLNQVIAALNRWLHAQAAKRADTAGMATTLSALVLRGRRWYVAHVGDSRVYLLREGRLRRLTSDHVWEHPELSTVLARAVGLDKLVTVDYFDGELREGDVFALLTDGIWSTLRDARIQSVLERAGDAQSAATDLGMLAVGGGAQDNCTALVLRVEALPADNLRDSLARVAQLPLPPRLAPGESIDGLRIEGLLHESRVTLLYRATDPQHQRALVLKTLRPDADEHDIAALAHEEWLARRVADGAFPQVLTWPARQHLYYLMSWHDGETLAQRMARGHRYGCPELAALGVDILRAVAALHRLGIVHRDIKPDNLHLGTDGRLRMLDLGVAASDANDGQAFGEINNPGTPSYMAPELFSGSVADEASDLYAVGVSLYQLLTRRYPYGEIEPFQKPRFGDPTPPTRYRPDTPAWLEAVLLKACARDPAQRFETAEEFLLALERGAHRPLVAPRRTPLARRDPMLSLKLLAACSLVLNLFLAYLLVVG